MGALVFAVDTGGSLCTGMIAEHIEVSVRLDGALVGGSMTLLGGDTLVWRPEEPLPPGGDGIARIVVDNAALGPTNGEGGISEDGPCGPELLDVELPFTVAAEEASPLPPLPPPIVEVETTTMNRSFAGVTCCPEIVPIYDDGGCEGIIDWRETGSCAFLYEETRLRGSGPAQALPHSIESQVWYQLYVDGEAVAGGRDAAALFFHSPSGACATLEATHLGTGEVVTSQACLSPAQLASLGPHALPLDDLTCPESQVCADAWSLDTCVPLDPEELPPPPPLARETRLSPECGGPGEPWVEVEAEAGESDDAGASGGGADGPDEVGCGCREGVPSSPIGPWSLSLLLALGLRRRA